MELIIDHSIAHDQESGPITDIRFLLFECINCEWNVPHKLKNFCLAI